MTKVSLNERDNADECGCRHSMVFLSVALAWVVGQRFWGEAELWTLNYLWLVLGAGVVGKLIGILLFKGRSRFRVRTEIHERS